MFKMNKYGLIACLVLTACSSAVNKTSPALDAGSGFDANFIGCVNDMDCVGLTPDGGTYNSLCGGEVCSWDDPLVHKCVSAINNTDWCGDPNLPQDLADKTCKCYDAGATCNIETNFCSFTHQ